MKTLFVRMMVSRCMALVAVLGISANLDAAVDARGVLGFCRPNLNWYGTVAQENALLDKMATSGAGMKAVRLTLTATDPATRADVIAHIAHCNSLGIAVLLQPALGNPAFYPAGTTKRPGNDDIAACYGLSQIDPLLFEAQIGLFLQEAKDANVTITGIELGNELNWADYNGDLPVYSSSGSTSKIISSSTAWGDDDYETVRAGIVKYGSCLYRLSTKTTAIYGSGVIKKVTAGLADISTSWVQSTNSSKITPSLFLQILEGSNPNQSGATNYLNYVNGRGIHIYTADVTASVALTKTAISNVIDPIETAVNNTTPFWITEWGYARSKFGTEVARFNQHTTFIQAVNQLTFPIAYSFLFGFDSGGYECYLPATNTFLKTREVFINYF